MASFGAPQTRLAVKYDAELCQELVQQADAAGLQAGTLGERDPSLDHGIFLPLYFLHEAGVDCPVLRIGLSGFLPLHHCKIGPYVAKAADKLGRMDVFVSSGNLSHKLRDDGPCGYAPEDPVFDRRVTAAMESGDFLQFLTMDPALCGQAAECGLRSFQMMAGALDGLGVKPKLLSYEGAAGVGYGVAAFTVTGPEESRCFACKFNGLNVRQILMGPFPSLFLDVVAFPALQGNLEIVRKAVLQGTIPALVFILLSHGTTSFV